ncbi:hypothetical protein BRD56_09980 [Thermoplasmatales archaeon SW_10_69_26]|nr:MAG: hypothetical protein BRD56_09980 [Thermoplasmatales archaeon SW_10_69_26]
MGEDRPEDAEATYQQAFAQHGETLPTVADTVETALEDARQAEPGSAEYAAASQTAKKGVLALSYHAAHRFADDDNRDEVEAYIEVLTTKFDGEEQLTETKTAVTDDTTPLDEAMATLDAEYRDLVTAKVYAETQETPELLTAGETTTAAKEAGEALGYALSLHAGDQSPPEKLYEELDGLVEHTLAQEEDATRGEADEILALLADHALQTTPTEKTQARQAYLAALDGGDIDRAETIYEGNFSEHASEYAPEAHDRINQALTDIRQADGANRTVQHEILAKSLLDVAWSVGFTELAEDEIHEGLGYLAILVETFDDPTDPDELGMALGHVAASQSTDNPHLSTVRDTASAHFLDKVHEEIDEVFINWNDTETAREKAIEGVLYYQPIREEVAHTLSDEDADHLADELRGLYNATTAGDREEAEHEAEEARDLLASYENAGEDVTEIDTVLTDIERSLSIITVEIEEYVDYKAEGNDEKANEEVEESKAFIGQAIATFEDNRQTLAAADAQAADELEADMTEIQDRLEAEEDIPSIPDVVERAIDRLDAFETDQPEGPAVDVEIGDPVKEAETVRVPIRLADPPEGGYSVQATITYDAERITVDSVEIPAEVGAETSSPGEIRFNAAETETPADPVIAQLHLAPADPDAPPELSVDVETLTDGQGDPLALGNVTGQQLDLASVGDAGPTSNVPLGPGALVASIASALALARRRP